MTDHTQLSLSRLRALVDSLKPDAAQAAADAVAKAGAALQGGLDNDLNALMHGHGFEDQFRGALADRFFHAAFLLSRCGAANAQTAADAAKPLAAFASAMGTAKAQCQAKFAELDQAGGAENHPQLAKLVRQEVGRALNDMYQQAPASLGQFEPPDSPATPGAPVAPQSIGQGQSIPQGQAAAPSGGGAGGGGAPAGGEAGNEALVSLKQPSDEQAGGPQAAEDAAGRADPESSGKGPGDALGEAGKAAGDAGKGLGEAGKGLADAAGKADPSQALAGLADAFKPKDGAGQALADLPAGEGADAPIATQAAAFGSIGGRGAGHIGGGGGATAPAARHLTNAAGHAAAPAAPTFAQSAAAVREDAAQAANSTPMGMMPQMGAAGAANQAKTVGANKYLRGASANKDEFLKGIPVVSEQVIAGDGTVGALTEQERTAHVIRLEDSGQFEDELKEFKA